MTLLIYRERKVTMDKKSPMYYFIYTIFIVAFILITFFGVGPVVLADGAMMERMLTAITVLLIYFVWGFLFSKWRKFYR
ncbi:MAG: hypothetical protein WCY24_07190 [Lutispora sp.]